MTIQPADPAASLTDAERAELATPSPIPHDLRVKLILRRRGAQPAPFTPSLPVALSTARAYLDRGVDVGAAGREELAADLLATRHHLGTVLAAVALEGSPRSEKRDDERYWADAWAAGTDD